MSRAKDSERSRQYLYRNGQKILRAVWDKHQRELRELEEERRLKRLGLVRTEKPRLLVAERMDIEKAKSRLLVGRR